MDPLFGNTFDLDGNGHVTPEEELFGYTSMRHQQNTHADSKNGQGTSGPYNENNRSTAPSKDDDSQITALLIFGSIVWVLCMIGMVKLWFSLVY